MMMAAGRLLVILVLLMAWGAALGMSMTTAAFGVRDVPSAYCGRYGHIDSGLAPPFRLGTAAAIQLGNSNSCIAGYDATGGNYYQLCIPSWVVVTENGTTLAGEVAMNHAADGRPGTPISAFMRFMDRRNQGPVVKRALEFVPYKFVHKMGSAAIQVETKKVFSVTDLAGVVMAELKHRAEAHLGRDIPSAVVAVPRHLTYGGRHSVEFAASEEGAGFRGGVRAIDHQIAAAVAYGHHNTADQGDGGKTILVLRVGGRTSDATVFRFVHGTARLIYARDDYFLGGDDLTARIVDYMAEQMKQRHHQWDVRKDGEALRRLSVACEHAKKALSEQEETLVQVPGIAGGGGSFSAPLTRAKFEELSQDLLDRVMELVDGALNGAVRMSGGRLPRGAESPRDMVDEILLVGGSARIPKLRQLLKDYMGGREPNSRKGLEAEDAIVHGTAILSRPEAARYVEECFGK